MKDGRNYVLILWKDDCFRRRRSGFDFHLPNRLFLLEGGILVVGAAMARRGICVGGVRKFPSCRFVVLLLRCCVSLLILVWENLEIAWCLQGAGNSES